MAKGYAELAARQAAEAAAAKAAEEAAKKKAAADAAAAAQAAQVAATRSAYAPYYSEQQAAKSTPAPTPAPAADAPVIVGTKESTGDVIVKDTAGNMTTQAATPEVIKEVQEANYEDNIGKAYATSPEVAQELFEKDNVKVQDGYMAKAEFDKLTDSQKELVNKFGVKALNDVIEQRNADAVKDFKSENIDLGDNNYMAIKDWNTIPAKYQHIGLTEGYDAMVKKIDADNQAANYQITGAISSRQYELNKKEQEQQEQALKDIQGSGYYHVEQVNPVTGAKRGEDYDLVGYLRDGGGTTEKLRIAGFKPEDIKVIEIEAKRIPSQEEFINTYAKKNYGLTRDELMSRKQGQDEKNSVYNDRMQENDVILSKATEAYADKYGVGAVLSTGAARVGELVVGPAARAFRPEVTAKDIKAWEWALTGAFVALAAVPAVRGVAAGVRSGLTTGQAVKSIAVSEAKAVIDPGIEGAFKNWRDITETAVRTDKLPIEALEIRTSTVRIPLGKTELPADAAKILRDKTTTTIIKGDGTKSIVKGTELNLTPTALNEMSSVAVHSTPDIRPFMEGATVQTGREGGLFVSPNVHTRFTEVSAFGDLPKGNIPGSLIIRDPKIIAELQGSGKIYRGTTEVEKLLPAGVKLPKPSQILFTRNMNGDRIALVVYGDKFSRSEIAQMKFIGAKDTVKNIFAPAYRVSKTSSKVVDDLADAVRENKALKGDLKIATKSGKKAKISEIEKKLARNEERIGKYREEIDLKYRSSVLKPLTVFTGSRNLIRRIEPGERILATMARTDTRRIANRTESVTGVRANTRIERTKGVIAPRTNARTERTETRTDYIPAETRRTEDARTPGETRVVTSDRTPTSERVAVTETRITPPREPIPPTERVPDRVPPPENRIPPPERRVPPPPPPEGGKPPVKIIGKIKNKETPEHTPEDYRDAATWKQGIGWWIVFPDKSVEWSKNKPEGVKELPGPGANTPESTIQVYKPRRGGKTVTFNADMGNQDVLVTKTSGRVLNINFRADRRQHTTNPVQLGRQRFKSKRDGRIFRTKIGKGEVISRKPL
jgi:hypothetical protein